MTRLPIDAFKIEPLRGEEYPSYKVAALCALDGCSSLNVSVHHITRRSWTIGPVSWVRLGDKVIGNLMPLCFTHHNEITDNKARIVWDEEQERYRWEQDESYRELAQPPSLAFAKAVEHADPPPSTDKCPTCLRRLPMASQGHEEKRPRKTWTITVPADAREIGADVLDTLLESARLVLDEHGLSYGHERNVRYFVLSTTLGIFVAQADEILGDG